MGNALSGFFGMIICAVLGIASLIFGIWNIIQGVIAWSSISIWQVVYAVGGILGFIIFLVLGLVCLAIANSN